MSDKTKRRSALAVFHNRQTAIRWGLFGSFVLIMALLLPKDFLIEIQYEVGKPYQGDDLYAHSDFAVLKHPDSLELEQQKALESLQPVFDLDNQAERAAEDTIEGGIERFARELGEYSFARRMFMPIRDSLRLLAFMPRYKVDPDELLRFEPGVGRLEDRLYNHSELVIDQVYRAGFSNRLKSEIKADFKTELILLREGERIFRKAERDVLLDSTEIKDFVNQLFPNIPDYEKKLLPTLIIQHLRPNVLFNEQQTFLERERISNSVSPVRSKVKKGDKLIGSKEIVTPELDLVLQSYRQVKREDSGNVGYLARYVGQGLMISLLTVLLVLFLRSNRQRIFYRNRKLAMILMLYLFVMGLVVLALNISALESNQFDLNYVYLVPASMVPIMLTAFFDRGVGFLGNILIGLYAGILLPNGFEYFFIQLCAGTIAVNSITNLRNRADFFLALGYILLTYVVAFLGYNFFAKGSIVEIPFGNLLLLLLNVVLTVITYPVIYIFEKVFKITSDLTYIELLDTNHPLMRDLSLRAPGTFQHSLQVANISEAVVSRIGGNGLQAKVGSLFHDIGKSKNPAFFIENQQGDNPHDVIPPDESARLIIAHVTDGIAMARENNLPIELIDFIRTHHGTSRVEYFYQKFLEANPDHDDDSEFRYPGVLPFSKETAAVMIVDTIEAASRSLKNPTREELNELVDRLVQLKVSNGQLKNANITFRDLETIKQVIKEQLGSIHHGRIEYPEARK